jgi:nucleotide-binding universal stress UspA family protein
VSVKDIAVLLDARPSSDARLDIAARIAIRHRAHVIGIHVELPMSMHSGDGMTESFARGGGLDDVITRFVDAERAADVLHRQRLDQIAAAHGLGTEWRTVPLQATLGEVVPYTHFADLIVLPQRAPHDRADQPFAWSSTELVVAAGMPCIVVPETPAHRRFDERIVVAWNASRGARRALSDAMLLLVDANEVIVLIVEPKLGSRVEGRHAGADIVAHLARHGVRARIECVSGHAANAGEAIVRRATELDAELLVAGAYGHSRFTEFVLGSTTRTLLELAPMPVMLSH